MHKAFFAFLALFFLPGLLQADPAVREYPKNCSKAFPCPEDLQRRMDFWIEVFQRYGKNTVVFHDSEKPERVYSVIQTKEKCSIRKKRQPRKIKRERSRIKKKLGNLAKKFRKKGGISWTKDEAFWVNLFPNRSSREVRESIENIRCQEGGRDRFLQGLKRYGRYHDYVLTALRLANLPEDIQFLPFVESSYDPRAYSRVGAAGMWQIMPRTARRLGLKVNATVDERFDPLLATHGAIRYLERSYRSLYKRSKLPSNAESQSKISPFAITSYNYGLGGMRRAIRQFGPDYMKVLRHYRGRRFRTAAKNFYASFLAARHVAQNAKKYFPRFKMDEPLKFNEIFIPRAVSAKGISDHFDADLDDLRKLNMALTDRVWKGRRLIPAGYPIRLPKFLKGWEKRLASVDQIPVEEFTQPEESYRVRRGDTSCQIAYRFGVSCREFIRENRLGRRAMIRIGQIVRIPARGPLISKKRKPKKRGIPALEALEPVMTPQEITKAFGVSLDIGVTQTTNVAKQAKYLIRVEVDEGLHNYIDWLDLKRDNLLLEVNRLKITDELSVGHTIKLPIQTPKKARAFEQKRIEYHRLLQEEFNEHFDIIGQDIYEAKVDDTPASISNMLGVPLWLLKKFNSSIFAKKLQEDDEIFYPVIRSREEGVQWKPISLPQEVGLSSPSASKEDS